MRRRLLRQSDFHQCREVVLKASPGDVGGTHLNDHAAKAPKVSGAAVPGMGEHLGGHPGDRAAHGVRQRVIGALGAAEVGELHGITIADEDVAALDVPVNDRGVRAVQILQAFQDLLGVRGHKALSKGAELVQRLSDAAPGKVLEVQVEALVQVVVPKVSDNVRMLQRLHDVHLVLQRVLKLRIALVHRVDGHLLDCNDGTRLNLLRPENSPQRAAPYHWAPSPLELLSKDWRGLWAGDLLGL
mmetsp:Transcript_861/g.2151  ORF Transcript_861/g.2151 Transcript_861/m.2151 type:complete len:243 (-) Transcript_861:129-857(-)